MLRPSLLLFALGALWSAPAHANNLRITIVSATISGDRLPAASGSRGAVPYSDLACYALPGLRSIAESCGVRMAADGVTVLPTKPLPKGGPVDPLAVLELGELVVRTYPVPSTLTPRWNYSVVVAEKVLKRQGGGVFVLKDWVGADKEVELGRSKVKLQKLLRPGRHTVQVGPAKLAWKVERLKPAPPRVYAYAVPADRQIADLARDAPTDQKSGEYVAVPVSEGEIVEVKATGKVQPNAPKYPERTAGPDGIPTIATKVQYNQPGFRDGQNHGALIAQLGATSMLVGARKRFVAKTAGLLVLAINDLKTSDNGGAFRVQVLVGQPAATDQAGLKRRGSAADTGPRSLSPRVVQQIVDSKAAAFSPCFGMTSNPTGSVTLQFLITGDGRPVVSVARASPNLQKVGKCMAQKASGWTFPKPRGTVVVQYPMHLSVQ